MNLAPDHEAIVIRGARTFVDDDEARAKYWANIADAIRTLRPDDMNEKGLRRAVNIAIARAYRECASCGQP